MKGSGTVRGGVEGLRGSVGRGVGARSEGRVYNNLPRVEHCT